MVVQYVDVVSFEKMVIWSMYEKIKIMSCKSLYLSSTLLLRIDEPLPVTRGMRAGLSSVPPEDGRWLVRRMKYFLR